MFHKKRPDNIVSPMSLSSKSNKNSMNKTANWSMKSPKMLTDAIEEKSADDTECVLPQSVYDKDENHLNVISNSPNKR